MPFTFQAPQPFAPAQAADLAAAQTALQAAPQIADLYARAGALRQQASVAEADRFAQNARVGASLASSDQQAADRLQFQKDSFAASLNPHARDVFAAQVGEAAAQQHAQLQAWVHAQDFTFQDNQRLANQQAALAEVQRAYDQKEITQGEWSDMVLQLKSGIDPAKQRQERAMAQQQEAHAQQFLQQAQLEKRAELQQIELEKKLMDSGEGFLIMPGRGAVEERVVIKNPRTGEWYNPLNKGGKAGEAGGVTEEQYLKHRLEVIKSVDAWAKERDKQAAEKGQAPLTSEERQANYRDALEAAGLGGSYADHLARTRGGPAGAPAARGPAEPGAPADVPMKPFAGDDQANPIQRSNIDAWAAGREAVKARPDLNPTVKAKYVAATYTLDSMLRKYGSLSAVPDPDDKAEIEWANGVLQEVAQLARPKGPPPRNPLVLPTVGGRRIDRRS